MPRLSVAASLEPPVCSRPSGAARLEPPFGHPPHRYVNNEEHARLLQAYRSGSLGSFSSMLARLHAPTDKPLFWHVRCDVCAAVNTGYPERVHCRTCGARVREMPLF